MDENGNREVLEKLEQIRQKLETLNRKHFLNHPSWNIAWGVIFGGVGLFVLFRLWIELS